MCFSTIKSQSYSINNIALPEKREKLNQTVSQSTEQKIPAKIQDINNSGKIAAGKAISNVNIETNISKTQSLSAATQTLLKASASNGFTTSIGLSVGGAVAGIAVAKVVGIKALPVALLGSSVGSLIDRSIGIARNVDKIKESYQTGKTDSTKFETVINSIGFALDIAGAASSVKMLKASKIALKTISASESPVSEGFRQYKEVEKMVGKNSGAAWENSLTKGIPTPNELAKIKGSAKISGAEAFLNKEQNIKLQGANIKEIVSKVPKEAQLRELSPSPTIKEGFEYAWVDKKTNMDYRLRIHGADLGVAKNNPTSTAAQGWIARVERNPAGQRAFPKTEYLTIDGTYHKASELMSFEKQKKEAELAVAVIKDIQTAALGGIDYSASSEAVAGINIIKAAGSHFQQEIQTAKISKAFESIEHFHHGTHIAVGGGLNKAIIP